MKKAAKGRYVSGKLLICLSGTRMLSRQAGARFHNAIEESKVGKDPVGSKRIEDVEVTIDDCILAKDLSNETLLVRTVVEVFEIKTLCFVNLHVFNTQGGYIKL